MNGVTADSMKQKGAEYKISWGASIMHLREMAADYEKSYLLAIELWKSEVRECKILATLLMPPEEMDRQTCDLWMEQLKSQEVAEQLVLNLLQNVSYAPQIAYEWMASDKELYLVCAYNLIGRLFMKGQEPNESGINEYLDQLMVALRNPSMLVQRAAMNSVMKFADLGEEYETIASKALKRNGFDLL